MAALGALLAAILCRWRRRRRQDKAGERRHKERWGRAEAGAGIASPQGWDGEGGRPFLPLGIGKGWERFHPHHSRLVPSRQRQGGGFFLKVGMAGSSWDFSVSNRLMHGFDSFFLLSPPRFDLSSLFVSTILGCQEHLRGIRWMSASTEPLRSGNSEGFLWLA